MEDRRSASHEDLFGAWPRYRAATNGFRNYWYPVMFSSKVGSKPVPLTVAGDKILLIRSEGKAYALHDRCAHRGVPLSYGRREFPGTITCAYHAWTYDVTNGKLVAVLTDGPDCAIVGKDVVSVRSYPVEERAGIVFVYVGEAPPPPVEEDIPADVLQPGTTVVGVFRDRPGNWRYACENGFDEGHAQYLHRGVVWTFARVMPVWRITHIESEGPWLVRVQDKTTFRDTYPGLGTWPKKHAFWQTVGRGRIRGSIRLPCWVRIERPGWNAYEIFAPVDESHYRLLMFLTKKTSGIGALIFHLWFWLYRRWAYMGQFNGQDQWMVESMQIPPERLYRPDLSITAWRRHCEENARRGSREAAGTEATAGE